MISDSAVKLSDILSPAFRPAHAALMSGEASQLVLKGGRGSGKSSYASVEVAYQLLKHPEIHAVVLRKVQNTLRTTVYAQYKWAIDALNLNPYFKCTLAPMEITFMPTGQKILFFGADDPGKIKSIKVPFGYIGLLHFEELDQFNGEEEIRNIEQSTLRGGKIAIEIKSFNPPQTAMNWANKYCQLDKPGQMILHTDYRSMPEEWLGQRFLADAEYLRDTNYKAYEHEYLGIANGTGGAVFDNVKALDMSKNISPDGGEIVINGKPVPVKNTFDHILNGLDWGYYPDPFNFVRVNYDAARRDLYIWDEVRLYKAGNLESSKVLRDHGITDLDPITCDSAEPKSIGDYRSYGFRATGAEKGPGSVEYSMKWLASLNHIYIDPKACPSAWEEFTSYEYERNRDGEVVSGYPDANNHSIDAVRYATEKIWRRRGQ